MHTAQEAVNRETSQGSLNKLDTDLLYFHELTGGRGHGNVPKDQIEKRKYLKKVKRLLMSGYRLSEKQLNEFAQLYSDRNNGPVKLRRKLREILEAPVH